MAEQRIARWTLIVGILHGTVAFSLLFLPVIGDTSPAEQAYANPWSCPRRSYIQMGGNTLGYTVLLTMLGIGIGAVVVARPQFRRFAQPLRWFSVFFSLVLFFIGGYVGLVFASGGFVMLIVAAAHWAERQTTLT